MTSTDCTLIPETTSKLSNKIYYYSGQTFDSPCWSCSRWSSCSRWPFRLSAASRCCCYCFPPPRPPPAPTPPPAAAAATAAAPEHETEKPSSATICGVWCKVFWIMTLVGVLLILISGGGGLAARFIMENKVKNENIGAATALT
jgi:hypothetical protein